MATEVKPDFIFVGATRSAGMYITKVLASHPEIFVGKGASRAVKNNLHFFNENLEDKYFRQFSNHGDKIVGEGKRGYYLYMELPSGESAAEKIYQVNPETKIIISLRNPIERAFSHYSKLSKQGVWKSPRGLINDYDLIMNMEPTRGYHSMSRIITDSLYYKGIKEYMDLFSNSQVKIIFHYNSEWFDNWDNASPQGVFEDLYSFLGVDQDFVSPILKSRINTSSMTTGLKNKEGVSTLFSRLALKLGFYRTSNFFNSYISESPKIDKDTYSFLLDLFMDDILNLESFLDVDLASWKAPYNLSTKS
ncbi:MAG: hypothetical protein CL780_06900 [Chloroflexi bacterium]|nr:hypothetical protein [Chloroflexota bacterium]|tara:strand:+ start:212 stop:1129 length:918 start_codon:yes stop_codon:yes gene_type:complete